MDFINGQSSVTDEEYSQRNQIEKKTDKEDKQVIDISVLESIKYSALENDFETVDKFMTQISIDDYRGDDKEFLAVLIEAVESRKIEVIDELVTTYMDLKL